MEDWIKANFTWYAQASLCIKAGDKNIFIDPHKVDGNIKADLLLITHDHFDHYNVDDIKKVIQKKTILVVPEGLAVRAKKDFGESCSKVESVGVDYDSKILGIGIKTIPAYNPKKKFHPKKSGWVGYILDIDGKKVYHAGDTNRIDEMKGINVDISMLPLGQTYTMDNVEEAVDAAVDTGCKIAIPIHFGWYEGDRSDGPKFQKLCEKKGIKVLILPFVSK